MKCPIIAPEGLHDYDMRHAQGLATSVPKPMGLMLPVPQHVKCERSDDSFGEDSGLVGFDDRIKYFLANLNECIT